MHPRFIREALEKQPFDPFVVITGDGDRVKVMSKEFAHLHPSGRTLFINEPKGRPTDRVEDYIDHTIDVFLITKITTLPKNGGKRRKKAS
jgi:hypothetical protein